MRILLKMGYLNHPVFKILIWMAAEILLNFIGLDDLADYGEFIFERKVHIPETLMVESAIENHANFWNRGNNRIPGFRV